MSVRSLRTLTLNASLKEVFHGNDEAKKRECLQSIGEPCILNLCLKEVLNARDETKKKECLRTEYMFSKIGNDELDEMKERLDSVIFSRKKFCVWVSSSREEAKKHGKYGYFTFGSESNGYGYFKGCQWNNVTKNYETKPMTKQQIKWLNDWPECCYYYGYPCMVWKEREAELQFINKYIDECARYGNKFVQTREIYLHYYSGDYIDCNCVKGRQDQHRQYNPLGVTPYLECAHLDESREKRYGVWQQNETWTLNGGHLGEDSIVDDLSEANVYYSLEHLKEDAVYECDHEGGSWLTGEESQKNCTVCKKILSYDGKTAWSDGNIEIRALHTERDASDECVDECVDECDQLKKTE